jgi:hypothetical protein
MFDKLISVNSLIVISLCTSLFFVDAELQQLIITGLIGFLGGGVVNSNDNIK